MARVFNSSPGREGNLASSSLDEVKRNFIRVLTEHPRVVRDVMRNGLPCTSGAGRSDLRRLLDELEAQRLD
jgi:hypothetical protein